MSNKNLKNITLAGVALTLATCVSVNADSLSDKDTKVLNLQAENISRLNIDAAAGFLKVSGDDSINEIQVKAMIEAPDEDIKLSLKQDGNRAILIADANPKNHSSWGFNTRKIDLVVKLPSNLILQIHDGSGEISVNNIKQKVKIDDGSGSMEIHNIKGDLEIDDGSGSLTVTNISGNVRIDDGSGSMRVENIDGKLNIEDGSGSMDILEVSGLVTIDDGSGSINLKQLHNGLTIIEEGSGGLKMSDVKGPISMQ